MPDMTIIANRFAAILTSRPCRRLDYWLGGMHVTGMGLATIARAIRLGGEGGKGIRIIIEQMGAGVEASYDPRSNELVIPGPDWAITDRMQQLSLVHEAIHALRDLQGRDLMWNGSPYRPLAVTDEATAYLGGCLYDIYWQEENTGAISERPLWLTQRKAAIHAVAYKIALEHVKRPAGSAITRDELSQMNRTYRQDRRRIGVAQPHKFDNDGIPMPFANRR